MAKKEGVWMKVNMDGSLPGDSKDYEIITRAMQRIPQDKHGMTCEIGLRKGGGSGVIMDALAKGSFPDKVHVAVDPFGNIIYAEKDGVDRRLNYVNEMRDKYIGSIYLYAMKVGVNMIFINMDDMEFFKRYDDGVPVYNEEKFILNEYIFVHFDGPHQLEPLKEEFYWFNERMTTGATIVFDDVEFYDHDNLEHHVINAGWKLLEKSNRKASYQKVD